MSNTNLNQKKKEKKKKRKEEAMREGKKKKKKKKKKRRRQRTGRRRKKKGQRPGGRGKKVKKSNIWTKPMCKCTRVYWVFLSIKQSHFLLSVFFSFWRENFLVSLRRKHLGPIIYFPSSLVNQIHSKKVFLFIFSPKFFIYPISPPYKHTLNDKKID